MGAFTAGAAQYGMVASAIAGGISSKIQGGNFGHGFWSAGLGAGIGGGMGKGWAKVVTAAVVGGTVSKLTGGKFKNGAISAAFAAAMSTDWGDKSGSQTNQNQQTTQKQKFTNALSVGDVLGKIWNLPNTLIGLAYGGVGHLYGLMTGTNPYITIGNNAIQFHNNPFMTSAMTLENVIIYGQRTSPTDRNVHFRNTPNGHTVGREEYRHTLQGQALGPLYFPAHIIGGISSMFMTPNSGLMHPVDGLHSNNFMETGPMQDETF